MLASWCKRCSNFSHSLRSQTQKQSLTWLLLLCLCSCTPGGLFLLGNNIQQNTILQLRPWWECTNMTIWLPYSTFSTGFPFLPGLNSRFPFSHTNTSMEMPPPWSKNCLSYKTQLPPTTQTYSTYPKPNWEPFQFSVLKLRTELVELCCLLCCRSTSMTRPDSLRAPQSTDCFKKASRHLFLANFWFTFLDIGFNLF